MNKFEYTGEEAELTTRIRSAIDGMPYVVHVSKVGGGTPGETYTGTWDVEIIDATAGDQIFEGPLVTGTPQDHWTVAYIALDFYEASN